MPILWSKDSLKRRMRNAQTVLVALMLIPALLAIILMMVYAWDYHSVIEHMSDISSLRPVIQQDFLTEIMDVVSGRKRFEDGHQFETLEKAQTALDELITSNAASRIELEVSRRLLNTLYSYVETLGEGGPVDTQIQLNDEINNVAVLFLDMLQEAVNTEINTAAIASAQTQFVVRTTLALELGLLVISLLFAALTQNSLSKAIRIPLSSLEDFAGRIAGGELTVRAKDAEVEELRSLTNSLNTMAYKLGKLMEENRKEQENLKKSELRALQAQITPHFLYNTLDAIIWLAEAGQTQQVIEITSAMCDFFRISLNNGRDWVTIGQEWEHLEGYLTIQKIRYRDILQYELSIEEELKPQQMLKLLIQPLVENAIYHGVKNRRGGGTIWVTAKREKDRLQVKVADNGIGMTGEQLTQVVGALAASESTEAETGYGLYSVDKRIKMYYNQAQGLSINSSLSEGTEVSFDVPMREAGDV